MIRPATEADLPRLMEMGEKFAEKARLSEHVGYDPASMEATFRLMIAGGPFVLFIGEHGAIGGMKAPHPFNRATQIVDEIFWWSEGREGLRLLDAWEEWAGTAIKRMTTLEAVEPERVSRLLERRGYRPLERVFIRN